MPRAQASNESQALDSSCPSMWNVIMCLSLGRLAAGRRGGGGGSRMPPRQHPGCWTSDRAVQAYLPRPCPGSCPQETGSCHMA